MNSSDNNLIKSPPPSSSISLSKATHTSSSLALFPMNYNDLLDGVIMFLYENTKRIIASTISINQIAYFLLQPLESSDSLIIKFLDLKTVKFDVKNSTELHEILLKHVKTIETNQILPNTLTHMQISSNENYILIYSQHLVLIVKLSSSNLQNAIILSKGITKVKCKVYNIGEYYYTKNTNESFNLIRCVQFHSVSVNHLFILSSDNKLRIFNLKLNIEVCEQEYNLNYPSNNHNNYAPHHNYVSFVFGLTSINNNPSVWELFTIYLLCKDSSIAVICPIFPYNTSLPYTIILEFIQTELLTLQDFNEKNSNMEYNNKLKEIKTRINWLRSTFFDTENGENEENTQNAQFVTSRRCDELACVQGPIPCTNTENNNNSLYTSANDCIELLLLNDAQYPLRFIRIFASGTLEILLGFYPIEPSFLGESNLSDCLLSVNTVELFPSDNTGRKIIQAVLDKFESNSVIIQSNYAVYIVRFPWINEISAILEQQLEDAENEENDVNSRDYYSDAIAQVIQNSETKVKTLFTTNKKISHCLLTYDPSIGKYLVILDNSSNHSNTIKLTKYKEIQIQKKLLMPSASETKDKSKTETNKDKEPTAADLGILPFSEVIAPFLSKYPSNFSIPQQFPSNSPPININNAQHLQLFLQQQAVYSNIKADLQQLSSQIDQRIRFLIKEQTKQENLFLKLEKTVQTIIATQLYIKNSLKIQQNLQEQYNTQCKLLLQQSQAFQPLSQEEKRFQTIVHYIKNNTLKQYKQQLNQVKDKVNEIIQLNNTREVKMNNNTPYLNGNPIGSNNNNNNTISNQLATIYTPLNDQTATIGDLMKKVQTLKNQLKL